jgi:hypothetical protein
MSKTRIRRPASDRRPARRSLVELTAAASRAIDDGLLVTASPNDPPRSEPAAKTHNRTMVAAQVTAPIPVAVPESLNAAAAAHNGELVDSDSTAEMAMKIAEDYHNRAFKTITLALDAALDRAKFRAEALELMKANVITTMEYAQELAGTTTAAEFVELSGMQARKQCELILKQAGALKSLAHSSIKGLGLMF